MEKLKPHYSLEDTKRLAAQLGATAFTKSAIDGGRAMNLTTSEMLGVIASLTNKMFYKSMTTYHDTKIWQDVYHSAVPGGKIAYIKITYRANAPIIQFKEK